MTLYYKATRPDGTDFQTGTIDYGAALVSGEVVRHSAAKRVWDDPSTYLSVSVSASDCTGFAWPCRLFRVEPVDCVVGSGKRKLSASPNKRACSALRVVEELPAWQALGPNGEAVAAFIERLRTATPDEIKRLIAVWAAVWDAARAAARDAVWDAARAAARDAARAAVWDTARDAVWDAARAAARAAAWDAARAAVVRDLITSEQYAILTQPFCDAGLGEWVA